MSKKDIFNSSKKTLKEMTEKKNGRYTEKDLFSKPGNYISKACKNTFKSHSQHFYKETKY